MVSLAYINIKKNLILKCLEVSLERGKMGELKMRKIRGLKMEGKYGSSKKRKIRGFKKKENTGAQKEGNM